MSKTLDTTGGIYNTEYTLTKHRDGTRTVQYPYIKWTGNSGSLAHSKVRVAAKHADYIDACFEQGDGGERLRDLTYALRLVSRREEVHERTRAWQSATQLLDITVLAP